MRDESPQPAGSRPSLFEEIREESLKFWRHMPEKALFLALLAAWLVFFHFLGNSALGYINTPSLLGWMYHMYDTSPDDGHGLLLPFVVLALMYWKRAELMDAPKRVWWPALALVALSLGLHIIGYLVRYPQVSVVGFYFGIYALTGLVWGRAWMVAAFFPILLFGFGVPLGHTITELVTFPLRLLAAYITSGICGTVLGIEVVQRGTQLFDPTGRFNYDVGAACGGIRSLISLIGIGTVYAFMNFKHPARRLALITSAVPLAVVGNVFRLVCIVMAAEAFGKEAGEFVHDQLGLLPYVPAIAGLMLIGHWLREDRRPGSPAPTPGPAAAAEAGV